MVIKWIGIVLYYIAAILTSYKLAIFLGIEWVFWLAIIGFCLAILGAYMEDN